MASETLEGLKVAILVTDGFEEPELTEPVAGAEECRGPGDHRLTQLR